jgi:CBS domain containing-hemolysin-like protein
MACTDLMIKKGLQRLPVTDENGDIVGMVYIRDIFDMVAEYLIKGGANNGTC